MVNNSWLFSLILHIVFVNFQLNACLSETGGLFRIAIKLLLAAAATPLQEYVFPRLNAERRMTSSKLCDTNSDCIPLVNLIGVLFQIRDDYQNLQSSQVCVFKIKIYYSFHLELKLLRTVLPK